KRFATAGAAVQMLILNAAMKANPIGLIITAVTLLVAGFILMYRRLAGSVMVLMRRGLALRSRFRLWAIGSVTCCGRSCRRFGTVLLLALNGCGTALRLLGMGSWWRFVPWLPGSKLMLRRSLRPCSRLLVPCSVGC